MPVFTKKDFQSSDGMMTSIWGPSLWHTLHTISFNYPTKPTKKQKNEYFRFFKSLEKVLPCKYCRDNYKKNLKSLKFDIDVFKNRDSLSRWVYKLHEKINDDIGKKSNLKYSDVRERYEHFRSRCLNEVKIENPGCTTPLYGTKSKCVLNVIPRSNRTKSFKIDPKCKISKKKMKRFFNLGYGKIN